MTLGINALIEPLEELVDLFEHTNRNTVILESISDVVSSNKKKAMDFYGTIAKKLAVFHTIKSNLTRSRDKNSTLYTSLLIVTVLIVCGIYALYMVYVRYLFSKGALKSFLQVRPIVFYTIYLLVVGAFAIHMVVEIRDKMSKVDSIMYRVDTDDSNISTLINLFSYSDKDNVAGRNYILYMYYKILYDENTIYENEDACVDCQEANICSTLNTFVQKCNKDFLDEHINELKRTINIIFDNLASFKAAIGRKNQFTQIKTVKNSIEYFQNLMYQAAQNPGQFDMTPEKLDSIIENEVQAVFDLTFTTHRGLQPMYDRNAVDVLDDPGVTRKDCFCDFLKNNNYVAAFYDKDNKCTLYSKYASGTKAKSTYMLKYTGSPTHFAMFRKNKNTIDNTITRGCIEEESLSSLEKLEFCPEKIKSFCKTVIQDGDKKYYPHIGRDFRFGDIKFSSFENACALGNRAIDIQRPIQNLTSDAMNHMDTLVEFKDVVTQQLLDIIDKYEGRMELNDFIQKILTYSDTKQDTFVVLGPIYKEILNNVKKIYNERKEANKSQAGDKKGYISFEDFKASIGAMTEKEFLEVFCKHLNNLRDVSDGLNSFYHLYGFDREQQSKNNQIFKVSLGYMSAVVGLIIVQYALGDSIFYSKNYTNIALKYTLIIGIFAIIVSCIAAYLSKQSSVLQFNNKVIDNNGNQIKSLSKKICITILNAHVFDVHNNYAEARMVDCLIRKEQDTYDECFFEGDISCLRQACKRTLGTERFVNVKNDVVMKEMYQGLITIMDSVRTCNSVLMSASIKMPFPYLDILTNSIILTIAVIAAIYIVSKFSMIGRFQEIKHLISLKEKVLNYVNVPVAELAYYLEKSNAFGPEIKNFVIILCVIAVVLFTFVHSSTLITSSSSFGPGLYNSTYYNEGKCYS